jgi:hypothetical protein
MGFNISRRNLSNIFFKFIAKWTTMGFLKILLTNLKWSNL